MRITFPMTCFLFGLVAASCGTANTDGSAASDDRVAVDSDDTSAGSDGQGADGVIADDVPLGAGPYAVGTLEIKIEHPDLETVTYELACFGDTATLLPESTEGVRADRACTALARADVEAYLAEGPPGDRQCTEQWGGPDTARVVGQLNGRDIDIVVDRSNGCGIDVWDVLLADVLPVARGAL